MSFPLNVLVLDTPSAWADAIAALPAPGPLPARTVLVSSERQAHALRRALARTGRAAVLAGTRFVGPLTAAVEVLRGAGVAFSDGEEALRPARLLALFREDLPLEHFDLDLLRTTRGWEEAFAATIGELEAAGLSPSDLPRDAAQARDVAGLWSRLESDAGRSFSAARVYREAATLLARDPTAWPLDGAVLAAATGWEDAALARFLAAIPALTLGVWRARPLRPRLLERAGALFGPDARAALERAAATAAPPAPRSERDLLAAYLFADARALAAPDRPRSAGPDGTVDLEEHAGVDAELEATAAWVARQVLEARRPLEELAVLVPARDPLVALVAERLGRLPLEGGPLPVYVAGGLPATADASGARVRAILAALGSFLSAETLAEVLPSLRLAESPLPGAPPRNHLSHGEGMELAYGLGTVGGNAADPAGALAWSARAAARVGELEAALLRARRDGGSEARETWRLERTLRNLRAIRPALDALVEVARTLVTGRPLAELWGALSGFLEDRVLLPGAGAAIRARLAESLEPACRDALGARLSGPDALAAVQERLQALRVPHGRFGEPAVYVGTLRGAAGLDFAAVRVVGLCEGVLPSHAREDPVLPERLRDVVAASSGALLARADDRAAAQVHALCAAIGGAREAIALSAPRVDLARTEREPASLFVDAAASLARPQATTGAPAAAVPDTHALARDYFRPARAASAAFRAARPVSGASWLDRVARVAADLPPEWRGDAVLELGRVDALRVAAGELGPADGVLGPGEPFPPVPGLAPGLPISASALQQLLQCPRMFLLRRILHWNEPAGAPSLRELDAAPYGTLLHHVLEAFYRAHGAEFVAGERTLDHWQELARGIAQRELAALLAEYPLVGDGIRTKERERLEDSVRAFLRYDWKAPGRRYVGVELGFGTPEPLAVDAGGVTLHVTGYIDRVDVEGGATLVRDVKSGKAHRRERKEAGPTAVRDVQLGLYQLAAKRLASSWGTPGKVIAAYAYANGRAPVEERAFRDDADALAEATRGWLAAAARVLAGRRFAPTPDEEDCTYCPFQPLCGAATPRRAREGLAHTEDGALAAFWSLKLGEEDEG